MFNVNEDELYVSQDNVINRICKKKLTIPDFVRSIAGVI